MFKCKSEAFLETEMERLNFDILAVRVSCLSEMYNEEKNGRTIM